MKKTAMFVLMGNIALAQSFFVPTDYRGAFAPAPTVMWTNNWTNWDPQNTVYPAPTVIVTSNISVNTTWTSGNVYLLKGQIYVKAGATLTIQPGTIVMGDKASTGAGLFITKGSKIMAQGTALQPIIFTSNQAIGSRAIGDWGGVILLGKASNNQPGGIANIEGIAPNTDTEFGGGLSPEDNDNSGTMQYVRIEWGGYIYAPGKEINGLTFGSVGSGTTIDHIQVSFTNDDAFEWFGGTVNCRYLVSYRNLDDDFDTDFGFRGNIQFGLSVRDPNIADAPAVSTSEGFESDNDASGSTATPQTAAIFSNITLIGPYRGNPTAVVAPGYRRGVRMRRNTGLKIYNSIFMDHVRGVHIDGALCEGNAQGGILKFKNNLLAGNSPGKVTEVNVGSSFNIQTWFSANQNDSLTSSTGILIAPYSYVNPDYRPTSASPALKNIDYTDIALAGNVLFAPTVTSKINYCIGTIATPLTANTSNLSNILKWYSVPTGGISSIIAPTPLTVAAGTYTYYVAQANTLGFEGPRVIISVIVNSLPVIPTISTNGKTSFCIGDSVILTSNYSIGNNWSNASKTNTITVSSTGSYSVTKVDSNGCQSTSIPVNINVSNAPLPTVAILGSTILCTGQEVTLMASKSDSYLWSPGGQTTQNITVSAANAYNVSTTNANACNGVGKSTNTLITVNSAPTAIASVDSIVGNIVTFKNTSTGATAYSWDFGDASNSSAQLPVHAYASNGNYKVQLIASNGTCSDTTTFNTPIALGVTELEKITSINLYPNPITTDAAINISLTERTAIVIKVYTITGEMVTTLFNGEMNSGINVVNIDVANLQAGVYFTEIASINAKKIVKMVIMK